MSAIAAPEPVGDPAPAPLPSTVDDRSWPVAVGAGAAAALLVALALPASSRIGDSALPRWLAAGAVVLAVLTVAVAAVLVVLRLRAAGRTGLLPAVVAGLLTAAVALTGAATVAVLAGGRPGAAAAAPVEGLTVAISRTGDGLRLAMRAEMPDVPAGALVRAEVTGVADEGGDVTLARQLTVTPGAGPVAVELAVPSIDSYGTVRILVESPLRRCTADLRPLESEDPVVACRDR
ncbi:hypothetical protein GCM10020358_54600 [Amorphoplanes nipponensis]|uniref:Uncharacterized protein n=1 Tax=Actinoplanes nipponensis TaxID=135950 RepID=A0A919JS51_9ACTN|nr:hypothetical protein [Actinoplanes nipponensis]GIE54375.1 hypothetical protein Ani05nite_79090 [Actinoplanes nipponensis]